MYTYTMAETGPQAPSFGSTRRAPDTRRHVSADAGCTVCHVKRSRSTLTPIHVYAAVVLLNYAAQIPYAAHLYGAAFSRTGALLLGMTLAWFALGYLLVTHHRSHGYWVLLAYAVAQFGFYFHGEVLLSLVGFGGAYQLTHARDALLWLVFVVGDINFVAATLVVVYLLKRRQAFSGRGPAGDGAMSLESLERDGDGFNANDLG